MNEYILICIFVLITGACIGSFLNVVALRALSKESIVFPASKCPKCSTPIKWFDNIPVLSYFLTFRGKCRSCGEKVSIQYPIVEALTSIIFLIIFLAYGVSLKTLLLLILLSMAIVITITDIKKEYVYDIHSWIFIVTALIYSISENNIYFAFIGFVSAAVIMEIIARGSYYLVKKNNSCEESQNETESDNPSESKEDENEEEDVDINEYVKKYKRAFGEGDTYLAAGAGALLGVKYFLAAVACAIILQAVCILPQFIMNLYNRKEIRLLVSLSSFIVLAVLYFLLSNIFNLNIFLVLILVIALLFFAIDTILRLKNVGNNQGFSAIPFGPALLLASFLVLFFGPYIISFIKKYIFLIVK